MFQLYYTKETPKKSAPARMVPVLIDKVEPKLTGAISPELRLILESSDPSPLKEPPIIESVTSIDMNADPVLIKFVLPLQ